jgi:TPR repeat protein
MGRIYSQGLDVWRNLETAYMWYEICAANGSSFAKRLGAKLVGELTTEQVESARKRATKCLESNYVECS